MFKLSSKPTNRTIRKKVYRRLPKVYQSHFIATIRSDEVFNRHAPLRGVDFVVGLVVGPLGVSLRPSLVAPASVLLAGLLPPVHDRLPLLAVLNFQRLVHHRRHLRSHQPRFAHRLIH